MTPYAGTAESSTLREQDWTTIDFASAGVRMQRLITDLFPICRSITGEGLRQTLSRIGQNIPLAIHEVPTGTPVFDWTIPKEWNIRDAWIKSESGEKVVDFEQSNLHVVNYSVPVHLKMSLEALRPRLHTLPDHPDWIPYRTTYYKEDWGFCMTDRQFAQLPSGEYEVYIDSSLTEGSLTYGEYLLPGQQTDEVLLSCHVCHPSLCNDNLSGVALVTILAGLLSSRSLNYSYRFLFIPGTIGAITWLAQNEERVSRIRHGLVVACVGDAGKFHYKRSRRGNAEIDQAIQHVLRHLGEAFDVRDFSPYGYDERQYCSPGFNLPVGSLTRTPHGRFPQYHTSADNLDLICSSALADSLRAYLSVIRVLETNGRYVNLNPKCEPQLGRRGLYRLTGGYAEASRLQEAMLWVLNLSDGSQSLLEIAQRAQIDFDVVGHAAEMLLEHNLLAKCLDERP